jgi:hypothetical protein
MQHQCQYQCQHQYQHAVSVPTSMSACSITVRISVSTTVSMEHQCQHQRSSFKCGLSRAAVGTVSPRCQLQRSLAGQHVPGTYQCECRESVREFRVRCGLVVEVHAVDTHVGFGGCAYSCEKVLPKLSSLWVVWYARGMCVVCAWHVRGMCVVYLRVVCAW